MDSKPRSQEAFTLPRQWVAEMIFQSMDFARAQKRVSGGTELTDLDFVNWYLEFLDSSCERHGTSDLAAAQKANPPRSICVKFVGPR